MIEIRICKSTLGSAKKILHPIWWKKDQLVGIVLWPRVCDRHFEDHQLSNRAPECFRVIGLYLFLYNGLLGMAEWEPASRHAWRARTAHKIHDAMANIGGGSVDRNTQCSTWVHAIQRNHCPHGNAALYYLPVVERRYLWQSASQIKQALYHLLSCLIGTYVPYAISWATLVKDRVLPYIGIEFFSSISINRET